MTHRWAWLLLTVPLNVYPAPAGFVGARVCGGCHASEYRSQRKTYHARALQPILDSPIAQRLSAQPVVEPRGSRFDYVQSPEGLKVTHSENGQRKSGLLEWAFGAGAQGITPVGRVEGRYFEHQVSWYTRSGHAGLTIGQPAQNNTADLPTLGQMQSAETIYRCFNCHATGVRPGPDLSAIRLGIECERCHGPGFDHTLNPASSKLYLPRSPNAIVQLCGECHRLPQGSAYSPQPEVDQPESVRFAPIGLMASRCFQSNKLSCLTCHDPHDDLRHDDAFYTATCLNCHQTSVTATNCRRATKQACLPCHMPKSRAISPLTFTDHRIRVLPNAAETKSQWEPIERAIALGDYVRARQLLDAVPDGGARRHLLASKISDGLNDPARAVSEAQAARDLQPGYEAAWIQLGQVFLTHNTPLPALEIFDDAQQLFPGSLLVQLGKGLALKNLQRYDEAAQELRACLSRNPRLGVAFDALAAVYLQVSDFGNVAQLSTEFIRTNAADYRGYYYLAAANEGLKEDPKEIEASLREALRLNPNFAASYALLGKVLLEQTRDEEAARALEEAVRLRPEYSPAHLYLANAYRKLRREHEAAREFQIVRDLKAKEMQPPPALSYHRGK